MKKKSKIYLTIISIIFFVGLVGANVVITTSAVAAEGDVPTSVLPQTRDETTTKPLPVTQEHGNDAPLEYCIETGNCTFCHVMEVAVRIVKFIVGTVGALALLMFVIGGLMFVLSSGNDERVKKGKAVLGGAIKGLLIVLCSWFIVNGIILLVTKGTIDDPDARGDRSAKLFDTRNGWAVLDCSK